MDTGQLFMLFYINLPHLVLIPPLCVPLLLQVHYKKGHHERKAKYTSLADPPELELARKADQQRSDVSTKFMRKAIMLSSTLLVRFTGKIIGAVC